MGKKNGCFTSEVKNFTSESGFFFSESGFFLGVCGRNFADVKVGKLKDIYFRSRIFFAFGGRERRKEDTRGWEEKRKEDARGRERKGKRGEERLSSQQPQPSFET